MNKEEQREADIDAIAEVLYTAIHDNDGWTRIKDAAKRGGAFSARVVSDYRLQAEHVLASSWLDEKLEDARQGGIASAELDAQYSYDGRMGA